MTTCDAGQSYYMRLLYAAGWAFDDASSPGIPETLYTKQFGGYHLHLTVTCNDQNYDLDIATT